MIPKATLRCLLVIASNSLLTISSTQAAPYTWTQTGTGSQDWTTAGNWSSSTQFVSGSGNELMFFADTTTIITTTSLQTIINVPTTLSMNTLTLNGRGPNSILGFPITIGDSSSTWTIGDGTTSTVNLNSTLGGGSSDRDVRYTIAANLALNGGTGGTTTFTGNSTSATGAVFSGNITETALGKGITKSGSSLLIFSGSNGYTGTTLVSGGVLRLRSATALNGGIGTTGGLSALTLNGGVVELASGNFQRDLGSGSSQFQITGGTSGFSALGGPRVVTVNNDASQELQWGSATFAPTTLVLNAATANNSLELSNKIDLNAATRTVQVNAATAILSGVIQDSSAGTAGLTKSGNGTLVLSGVNTYTGPSKISAGTLSAGATTNLGNASAGLVFDGGTLQITGTSLTSLSGIGHTVTFTATKTVGLDIGNPAHTFTADQLLNQTSGGLIKAGAGTLVLNQANTFSGTTSATGGGTLVLDYTTQDNAKLSATPKALTLSGALILRGGSYTQTVLSTTLPAGNSTISRDGSSTATINLNAISRTTNAGELPTLALAEDNIATTDTTNTTGGILGGGWVTVGSNWAKNSTSAADGAIVGLTALDYASFPTSGGSGTVNYQLTGGANLTGNTSANTLRIANSADDEFLDLDIRTLSISPPSGAGGLLYAGGANNNYTITGTTSANLTPQNGNQQFIINVYTGTLNIEAPVLKAGSATAPLVKSGAGTLALKASNNYAGITYVHQGTLLVNNASGSGTGTGTVSIYTGATLGGTGTIGGNTTIANWGKLKFDLNTAPGSHDKLDLAATKTLTFSGASVLTITSAGGATTGLYTLVTAAGGITGSAPITVNLPVGWTAGAPQIVGNDLQINITSTGGGGSAYDAWKAANAPGSNPDDDTDGDGVSNAVEFVLGGTSATKDLDKLPVPDASGSNLTFIFERAQSSIDPKTAVFIETSTDLATWNIPPSPYSVPDVVTAGPPVTVVKGVPANFDTVTLTVPKAPDAKRFARLKVVITP